MPNSEMKSSFDVGAPSVSATSSSGGREGGPLNSYCDAQNIHPVGFHQLNATSANVDGSFTEQMKPESPGTAPAGRSSSIPGSSIFSSFECCDHSPKSGKGSSGGGSMNSSMRY